MFTGIITDQGMIKSIEKQVNNDCRAIITCHYDMQSIAIGASIACSGICLTVVEKGSDWFAIDASDETLRCTTMGQWQDGTRINLERSLKMGDELGGHIVSGHIDATAEITDITANKDSHIVTVKVPDNLKHYIAEKGSIAIDGISLTVNTVDNDIFTINIIPHTWDVTTLQYLTEKSQVNLEIDVISRYTARIIQGRKEHVL